ncbi:50S ribosomal protein L29 [Candidatus Parcubacteria bacterium]|nr:50S ribosomal protein L29 [Patescibacteria group bacterium]MBU4482136.1 50S ribosomal protein L29 [Patescibacteria group bacterium]MCG2687067.1 50S ribosomal protein L29 [Candidatus Parcubacteria bacterium]
MKIKELKLKSDNELKTMLNESREKLREMRFKVAQRQLKKVSDIWTTKKLIAQILTILKEKHETK